MSNGTAGMSAMSAIRTPKSLTSEPATATIHSASRVGRTSGHAASVRANHRGVKRRGQKSSSAAATSTAIVSHTGTPPSTDRAA